MLLTSPPPPPPPPTGARGPVPGRAPTPPAPHPSRPDVAQGRKSPYAHRRRRTRKPRAGHPFHAAGTPRGARTVAVPDVPAARRRQHTRERPTALIDDAAAIATPPARPGSNTAVREHVT